ncbi:MAG: hypothetical protein ACPLQO_09555 [Desulfotomaculales bacterium]
MEAQGRRFATRNQDAKELPGVKTDRKKGKSKTLPVNTGKRNLAFPVMP